MTRVTNSIARVLDSPYFMALYSRYLRGQHDKPMTRLRGIAIHSQVEFRIDLGELRLPQNILEGKG